jgi:hypothetical protein
MRSLDVRLSLSSFTKLSTVILWYGLYSVLISPLATSLGSERSMYRRPNHSVHSDILHPDYSTLGHRHRSHLSCPSLCNSSKSTHRCTKKDCTRSISPPLQLYLTKVYLYHRSHEHGMCLCPPLRRTKTGLQNKCRSLGRSRSLHGPLRSLSTSSASPNFPNIVLLTGLFPIP